jgi:putative ABC transport system ATP-binding protein
LFRKFVVTPPATKGKTMQTMITSTPTRLGSVASSALNLTKIYGRGHVVRALDGISMNIRRGELTAISGPAGSGKTTLLQCLAGVERSDGGRVFLGGQEISQLRNRALVQATSGRVSFVVQPPRLLPDWTVLQNILLPLDLSDGHADPDHLHAVVRSLGLTDLLTWPAHDLTTVQQQRVAIARAAITRPEVVFADTPDGTLDTHSAHDLPVALRTVCTELGLTVVLAARDPKVAQLADRTLLIEHGRLMGDVHR